MKTPDDFEAQLRRRTPRALPPAWRAEILAAAAQVAQQREAGWTERRQPAWQWGALAAAWAVIALLQFGAPETPSHTLAQPAEPAQGSFAEQRRLVAELLGSRPPPAAQPPLPATPAPRSGRHAPARVSSTVA